MINTRDVSFSYRHSARLSFPDLSLASGETCLLLGESGSGKTTLLHLLGGLLPVDQGNIVINNIDITTLNERQLDKFRGSSIGFIFQKNHLISSLTVKQNLQLAPFLSGTKVDDASVEELLQQLGLLPVKNANVKNISHGQAQRLAIARAVVNKPSIIFADEPTSALDDKNCERVADLLMSIANQQQSTLIIATHDQRLKTKIQKQVNISSRT